MASKSLVIVESPSKAKTINKYLGKDFVVKSSYGHVTKLVKGKKAINTDDWSLSFEIDPKKTKYVKDLKASAKGVENIYLATDLDREGEAIAWHLKEILGKKYNYIRVRFNEITKGAIQKAFENAGNLDDDLIDAQKARRILDRVIGYGMTNALWSGIGGHKKISAGRVQSVAVRLVVEREEAINSFSPEEYWEIDANIKHEERKIALKLNTKKSNLIIKSEEEANALTDSLKDAEIEVFENEKTKRKIPVKPPFITTTMQQTSSSVLGFSLKKTMTLAQDLYQGGYITYMRTDSPNISILAQNNCKQYLLDTYGEAYSSPKNFASKASNTQDAHEAIRPTDVTFKDEELSLGQDHKKLYKLIWSRFVASQMPQPEIIVNSIKAQKDEKIFETSVSSVSFDGFYKVLPPGKASGYVDYDLENLAVGILKKIKETNKTQHFTKPPSRYSEASLVKELEKKGIGRPSTYNEIITVIQERGYVENESRRLYAKNISNLVCDRLMSGFPNEMNYEFTAEMEKDLDSIATGKLNFKNFLTETNNKFQESLLNADNNMEPNKPIRTEIRCEACNSDRMMALTTPMGKDSNQFLGCEGFREEGDNQCKKTLSLLEPKLFVSNDEEEAKNLYDKKKCHLCGSGMSGRIIDEKRKLHVCSKSPICSGTELEVGDFIKPKGDEVELIDCHKCDAQMELKLGRFGKYYDCQSCTATRQLMKDGKLKPVFMDPIEMPHLKCEKCDDFYLLRDSLKGLFLAASQFPKNRETRAPLVEEVKSVLSKLPEKHQIFSSAPEKDHDGDPLVVRFNRKDGSQILSAEAKGKKKKYFFFFDGSAWKEKQRD